MLTVSCAILVDRNHRVLIARRSFDVPHPGLWEFPGGKLQLTEDPQTAAIREVEEEVGLICDHAAYWRKICHGQYHNQVELYFYISTLFRGQPRAMVGQLALLWVEVEALHYYRFPQANMQVIQDLQRDGLRRAIDVCREHELG